MPRLWVLLLVVWYRAVTMASTQHVDLGHLTNNQHGQASNSASHHNYHKEARQKRSGPTDVIPKSGIPDSKLEQSNNLFSAGIDDNEVLEDNKQLFDKNNQELSLESSDAYSGDSSDELLRLMTYYKDDLYSDDIFKNKEMLDSILEKCLSHLKVKKSFNAWGGKRSLMNDDIITTGCWNLVEKLRHENDINTLNDNLEESKRNKFSSWGGKRDKHPKPNSIQFQPWGGKRSIDEIYLVPTQDEFSKRTTFNSWGGKRVETPQPNSKQLFYYWGGKRSVDDMHTAPIQDKLSKGTTFNSWGGKRVETPQPNSKQLFYYWGGKRSVDDMHTAPIQDKLSKGTTFNSWGGKRVETPQPNSKQLFYYWGGKRSIDDMHTAPIQDELSKGTTINRWGGKSGETTELKKNEFQLRGDKQSIDEVYLVPVQEFSKRTTFNSWGGKRDEAPQPKSMQFVPWNKRSIDEMYLVPVQDEFSKRTAFNSWGGKRSLSHNSFIPAQYSYNSLTSSFDDDYNTAGLGQILYRNTPFPWQIYKELSVGPGTSYPDPNEQRRIKFNSWGGKRVEDDESSDMSEDKRTFNAWGGKRGLVTRTFNAWGGKRKLLGSEIPMYEGSKRTFNAWGG